MPRRPARCRSAAMQSGPRVSHIYRPRLPDRARNGHASRCELLARSCSYGVNAAQSICGWLPAMALARPALTGTTGGRRRTPSNLIGANGFARQKNPQHRWMGHPHRSTYRGAADRVTAGNHILPIPLRGLGPRTACRRCALSRPGARCRDCSRSVSPDLSPDQPCGSGQGGAAGSGSPLAGAAGRDR